MPLSPVANALSFGLENKGGSEYPNRHQCSGKGIVDKTNNYVS